MMLHYLRPRKDFERSVFDDFFSPSFFTNSYNSIMRTDVTEKENEYLFEVELPGYNREDVKITLEDGYMNIKVEKNAENNNEEKNYIRRERYVSTASRSYYVGNVDKTAIKAKFENGILNITVPKEQMKKTENLIDID